MDTDPSSTSHGDVKRSHRGGETVAATSAGREEGGEDEDFEWAVTSVTSCIPLVNFVVSQHMFIHP